MLWLKEGVYCRTAPAECSSQASWYTGCTTEPPLSQHKLALLRTVEDGVDSNLHIDRKRVSLGACVCQVLAKAVN